MSVLANRFRIFTDFPNPLAVGFNCFSEAAWELQMAFLKPPEECTQISRRLYKS
jgi:hypothetical protein